MLQIGWASRNITPTRPAMVQGQRRRRIGRSALDPLTVTALVLKDGDPAECAIFVSCDLAFPSDALIRRVRERVEDRLSGVPGDRVIVHATHTHTSLVIEDGFYDDPGDHVMSPAECEALVAERAVEAISEAWTSKRPQVLGRAFGHAVVGHNRYAVYADGHARMYGKTDQDDFAWIGGYEDHSLDMLFTWEPDGELSGVVLAIPCPSQVDEHLEQFSADFWHEIRVELRRRWGAHVQVLPVCSAAGDQSPHFLLYGEQEREMRERRGVTERQEIAQRVGDAVMRALECTHPQPDRDWPLAHRVKQLVLTRRSITRAERDWAQAAYEESVAKGDRTSWWPTRLQRVVECFDGVRKPEPFTAEIHVLRVGSVAIATNPFELFLDYGLQIKALSPAVQTILIQLAGRGMYLPSERAVKGGGYGAMPAVATVGPEGGRQLVTGTLELIGALFGTRA